MCLDAEMLVGLILIWIVAPLLLFGAVLYGLVKFIERRNEKLK